MQLSTPTLLTIMSCARVTTHVIINNNTLTNNNEHFTPDNEREKNTNKGLHNIIIFIIIGFIRQRRTSSVTDPGFRQGSGGSLYAFCCILTGVKICFNEIKNTKNLNP